MQVKWLERSVKGNKLVWPTKWRSREHQHAVNDLIQLREVSLTAFLQYSFAKQIQSADIFTSIFELGFIPCSFPCIPASLLFLMSSCMALSSTYLLFESLWYYTTLDHVPMGFFFPSPAGRQIVSTIKCLSANLNFHIKILQGIFACL